MTTENPPDNTPEQADAGRQTSGRPRRRSSVVAASVAAAVLLAGGGGAYWASTASDGDSGGSAASDGGDPPPLRLDGYGERAEDGGPGVAPGEPDPSGARYVAEGELPRGPRTAPVYRPGGEVSRERAEQLAKALDVPGKARSDGDTWKFGTPKDGSGPVLEVGTKAPGNWTYHRYGPGGSDNCAQQDGKGGGGPAARCPAPGGTAGGGGSDGEPVTEREAEQAAGPVLDAIGLSDAKLDASRALGAVRTVNAEPVLGGLPSYGWQTGLQVGSDGQLVGGSGRLAELVKGPEYPLMSAEQALKRLNAERGGGGVGIGGCASVVPHGDGDGAARSQPCTLPSKEDGAGTVKPAPSKISDAVPGQAVHFVDGEPALVPSWLFEVELPGSENTSTVTHPAVRDEHIARGGEDTGAPPESRPGAPGEGDGAGEAVNIVSYQVDGRTLTLHFWGGVCTGYSASAEVSGDTVRARVTGVEKNPGQPCIKVAKMFEEKVELKESPGDREVVDAADGKALPDKAPELK
ncbi:hypothetical protein [Streptomyces sp. NPDC048845]|uniref:hypothetical protein n=1 Tax=Streptomyces sp. NPDC048845 TaxID=3155390 RepID=UPI00342AAEDF